MCIYLCILVYLYVPVYCLMPRGTIESPHTSGCHQTQPIYIHYLYIYLYMYLYTCVCTCICTCVCTCVYLYMYLYIYLCICLYIYLYTCIYLYLYIPVLGATACRTWSMEGLDPLWGNYLQWRGLGDSTIYMNMDN